MSVASADLLKALNVVWDASALDAAFQGLWDASVVAAEFSVLHDQAAAPGQPFPYCVFDQTDSETTDRMSNAARSFREIRDVTVRFNVHAREVSGDPRTPKEIAAFLVEEIMKVFGGHSTVPPDDLVLDNGNYLISQYENDFGVREGHNEHQWVLVYLFRLDVPVMA